MDNRATNNPSNSPAPNPEKDCREQETPTGKCITNKRKPYCVTLRGCKSDQESAENAYDRAVRTYYKRKELFGWTQHNYELYRDFDICTDSELAATSTGLTASVKNFSQLSQTLYNNLKLVVKGISDLKAKITALGDAGYNLDKFRSNQDNASQWCLLTGKNVENCRPDQLPPRGHRPKDCDDADTIYEELILTPKKVLIPDINSLMQSATDTVGIQTFTNIDTLTTLQTSFATATTTLATKIQAVVKTRRGDLDTHQAELATAVQNCTTAGLYKYAATSVTHAEHCTVQFLCCPDCCCVVLPEKPEVLEPHLAKCECCICDIGEKIRSTYHRHHHHHHHHYPDKDCGCPGSDPIR